MLQQVRALLSGRPPVGVAALYLFGSHARGTIHTDSDIDIAALLDPAVHPNRASRARARLDLLARFADRLGAPVDLLILNDAPPLIGRAAVIEGRAIEIYDVSLDHAYRRDVQLRAADLEPFVARHRRRLAEVLAG